jgi:hypothetical protein
MGRSNLYILFRVLNFSGIELKFGLNSEISMDPDSYFGEKSCDGV